MHTQHESAMQRDRAPTNMNPTLRIFLLFYVLFIYLLPLALSQQQSTLVISYHYCTPQGNYTTNSAYQSNLNSLLTSIYTNTEIDYGFYNFTYGDSEDKVFAIALCRPDITPDTCRTCIRNASENLTTICPNFKEAIGGHDNCMLRYTNRSIFNLMEGGPYFWVYSLQNVSNITGFNQTLFTLLGSLRDQAAGGDSRYKNATGQIAAPDFQTIYGLVQCTPDLSQSECRNCLYNAFGLIPTCCTARNGGRVIYPSCNFRYEISPFYALPPSPPPSEIKKSSRLFIILVVSIVSSLILAVCIWNIFLRSRKRKKDKKDTPYSMEQVESLQYEFETIRTATNNFLEANKLGQGGFGAVYKGMLVDRQEIAVKRLSMRSTQGAEEFKTEIMLVAKLQHRNLARLLGFCLESEEKILVYEFVPNKSLDYFLFEYAMRGEFSVKSDVYSFGVLTLEIIAGRKNNSFCQIEGFVDLISYVWKHWREEKPLEVLDPALANIYSRTEVVRCVHIGLLCVQEDPSHRPTMASIVMMLNSSPINPSSPHRPGFLPGRTEHNRHVIGTSESENIKGSAIWSVDETPITETYPR